MSTVQFKRDAERRRLEQARAATREDRLALAQSKRDQAGHQRTSSLERVRDYEAQSLKTAAARAAGREAEKESRSLSTQYRVEAMSAERGLRLKQDLEVGLLDNKRLQAALAAGMREERERNAKEQQRSASEARVENAKQLRWQREVLAFKEREVLANEREQAAIKEAVRSSVQGARFLRNRSNVCILAPLSFAKNAKNLPKSSARRWLRRKFKASSTPKSSPGRGWLSRKRSSWPKSAS